MRLTNFNAIYNSIHSSTQHSIFILSELICWRDRRDLCIDLDSDLSVTCMNLTETTQY